MKLLVVLSGGMDSTTLLYDSVMNTKMGVEAISFDYGSKHNHKELRDAKFHCDKLRINHKVFKLDFSGFKSHLLKNDLEIPEGHYEDANMKKTVVPFRNAIMLSYAVGYAQSNGINLVGLGNHFGDHAIYPDCRKAFIDSFNQAVLHGTDKEVELYAPFTKMRKEDIVKIGSNINVEYDMTWSCYKGGEFHCGKCGTCVERKEAFNRAGVEDLTIYESD